jgi:hypothetical protein
MRRYFNGSRVKFAAARECKKIPEGGMKMQGEGEKQYRAA